MSRTSKNKVFGITAMVAILLLTGTVAYLASEGISVRLLEANLREEKLKAEVMLSEKLLLEKEIARNVAKIETAAAENAALLVDLQTRMQYIDSQRQLIETVQHESPAAIQLKKKYLDIVKQKEAQDDELAAARRLLKGAKSAYDDIEQTAALLLQQNRRLTDELDVWRPTAVKEIRVEPYQKNGRLTLDARKTKKLVIHLDVASRVKDLKFRITGPPGQVLPPSAGNIVTHYASDTALPSYIASVRNTPVQEHLYKSVEMVFTPAIALQAGIYHIDILDDTESIGSLQVKFR